MTRRRVQCFRHCKRGNHRWNRRRKTDVTEEHVKVPCAVVRCRKYESVHDYAAVLKRGDNRFDHPSTVPYTPAHARTIVIIGLKLFRIQPPPPCAMNLANVSQALFAHIHITRYSFVNFHTSLGNLGVCTLIMTYFGGCPRRTKQHMPSVAQIRLRKYDQCTVPALIQMRMINNDK